MQIYLPEHVTTIINILTDAGYEAYAVGGCVRDSVMGRKPDDWDITTSAKPQEVKALFKRTVDTGIRHGTVTVMYGKEGYEVTTYRIDGEYEDSRHPREVVFTASLREDLCRRDFTINAMAYNEREGLIDLFGGVEDIRDSVIRCVGDPAERFREDALRIMRAVRFSAQLGYDIESRTRDALRLMAPGLERISAERVRMELVKLILSPHPDYLRTAYETGVTAVILPELDRAMEMPQNHPHHRYSVGEHILHSLTAVDNDRILRLTMLFHDLGKPLTRTVDSQGRDHFKGHAAAGEELAVHVMRRLKFDNDTIEKVSRLVRYHDYKIEETPKAVRRAMNKIGADLFPYLLLVKRADVKAQSCYRKAEKLRSLKELERIYGEICAAGECVSLKELAVNGADLIAAGMKPGKEMGDTLNRLLELVLENPQCNTKEYLLSMI